MLGKRPDQASDRRDRREVRRRDRPVGNLDGKISFDREYEARHVERGEADIAQIVLEPELAIDRPVAQQALYDIGNLSSGCKASGCIGDFTVGGIGRN